VCGAVGGFHASSVDQILDPKRDPMQRAAVDTSRQFRVPLLRLPPCHFDRGRYEGVNPWIQPLHPLDHVTGEYLGRQFTTTKSDAAFMNREVVQCGHAQASPLSAAAGLAASATKARTILICR